MNNLYKHKNINYGFVVICNNCNINQIKKTLNSIKNNYMQKCLCVMSDYYSKDDINEIKKFCPIKIGKKTTSSLINIGMQNAPCEEWNFLVFGGSCVRKLLDRKFAYFIEDAKDILFPIVDRKLNFVDGTINGMLMQKKAFKEIGPFSIDDSLETGKLIWSLCAIEKGYRFKAVLGGSIS